MLNFVGQNSGILFSSYDLYASFEDYKSSMKSEIDQIDSNQLLNTAPSDLVDYLVKTYELEAPVLKRDQMTVDGSEVQVDVQHDQSRYFRVRNGPCYVPGQRIIVEVPFTGDPNLLYGRGTTYSLNPPRAKISGSSIILTFDTPHDVQKDTKAEIDQVLGQIEGLLGNTRGQVASFNASLLGCAEQLINSRRTRILANQGRVASLGIPLKQRSDAPQTYTVPSIRRKLIPALPAASTLPFVPEPAIALDAYEHILSVIQNMTKVMERSPNAFRSMNEEDLRQHFLVQLNGHYEGGATGETFNVKGKTDILLRANDRNVFIAECKFWKGPKKFVETIDQLLGYTAWRDTKTAILVFNRGTGLSGVLSSIKVEAEKHKNYKRTVNWNHETGFRYYYHHSGDINREFMLTVLVFDVPEKL